MPRLSCNEARFRLEAINSELEAFRIDVEEYSRTGDSNSELRIANSERQIKQMVKELREGIWNLEGHVRLKNIPDWKELPDEETLKKDFKFDLIWEDEYRQGRSLSDFEIQNTVEALPWAKVFEIDDLIKQKQQENPNHNGTLTTAEVLEEIDKAGYRAATFQELLAFGRDYWKPFRSRQVYGLNSVFLDARGSRYIPMIDWDGIERRLDAVDFEQSWGTYCFLVLRKSSS